MAACRSCGSQRLSVFLALGNMPLADGLLRRADLAKPEPRYPLDVAFCHDCSLVQILLTVPPEELFCRDYPYFSSFSDALLAHSKKNVDNLIATRKLGPQSFVVELASNDGYLLQFFKQRGVPVLGIDPAEGPAKAAIAKGIPTLNEFFTRDLAQRLVDEGKRADVVVGNNVLAHVADTNGFVAGIAMLLEDDGVAVIEAPYVKDLIDHVEFDTVYHEHLCYFSATAVRKLAQRHGLWLNHVEHLPIHGGSLRYTIGRRDEPSDALRRCLRDEAAAGLDELDYYSGFAARVERVKQELLELVHRLKAEGHRLAAYGAAAKGAILLNFVGLGRDVLDFVVDRNVHKHGRFMPGVHLEILPPEQLLTAMPSHVLILPWNFKDEILAQQAEYRRRGGKFIVPIPSPEVV